MIPSTAVAGAWVIDKGSTEVISTVSYHTGTTGFDDFGSQSENVHFSKWEAAVYGEYGFAENWSIVSRIAYQNISLVRGASQDKTTGLGASQISMKRSLGNIGNFVVSIQGGVSIPGSAENGLDLRLGDGKLEWEVRGLMGRPFTVAGKSGFIDVQVARKFRSEQIPNEWMVDITTGIHPTKKTLIMAQLFTLDGDTSNHANIRTLSSTKVQGSLVWFYDQRNGVQFFISKPIMGRNTIVDMAFGVSWWTRF